MKFSRSKGTKRNRASRTGGWMPREPPAGMSSEDERKAEYDDLAELLAATNAKRIARGKKALSEDEVQMQNWQAEQEMRRKSAVEEPEDPDDDWGR
jgi:hypothetical protein